MLHQPILNGIKNKFQRNNSTAIQLKLCGYFFYTKIVNSKSQIVNPKTKTIFAKNYLCFHF